jgi:hypothetical protein
VRDQNAPEKGGKMFWLNFASVIPSQDQTTVFWKAKTTYFYSASTAIMMLFLKHCLHHSSSNGGKHHIIRAEVKWNRPKWSKWELIFIIMLTSTCTRPHLCHVFVYMLNLIRHLFELQIHSKQELTISMVFVTSDFVLNSFFLFSYLHINYVNTTKQ